MADIFDEVDEDVRKERMAAMAKRYGPIAGGGVALILAIVAGVTFWRQHEVSSRQEAGAEYLAAVRAEAASPTAGQGSFAALAEEGPEGYQLIARFKQAETLSASGDRAGAIAALNGVDDLEAPERYKKLARLLALGLRSYDENAETLLPLVEPLTAEGEPWRALAIEQAAMLEWKLGNLDAARTRLEALVADLATPRGVQARAAAALTALPEG